MALGAGWPMAAVWACCNRSSLLPFSMAARQMAHLLLEVEVVAAAVLLPLPPLLPGLP